MRACFLLLVTVFLMMPVARTASQDPADDSVVHGTINVALGNENGIVVLTDSMITAGEHQLSEPGQKLFRLDDWTVCALAGFVYAPAAYNRSSVPELNTSAGAVIEEYARKSSRQTQQSIEEKLGALTFAQFEKFLREKVDVVFDLIRGDTQKQSFLVLKEGGHLVAATQPVPQEETARQPCVGRDDEARAVRGRARQNRATAGRGDDTTRRRDRVRAPGCGPGLEGHRREPARGSWDVAQCAGSGKTQTTRQDRASCVVL